MSYPTINISFQLAAKSSSWWGSGYQASSYLLVLSFIFNKCMRVIPLDNRTNCIWLDTYIHFPVLIGNVKEIIAQSTQNQDGYMRMFDNISQYMFRSQATFSDNFLKYPEHVFAQDECSCGNHGPGEDLV